LIQLTIPLSLPAPPGPAVPPGQSEFPNDRFVPHETSDTATQMGPLYTGVTPLGDLSVNIRPATGLPGYEWFEWTTTAAGTLTVTETTTQLGQDGGVLELHVFTLLGATQTLDDLGDSTTPGSNTQIVTVAVNAGIPILVEVKGSNIGPMLP
jgi:hypothetical protein